MAFAARKHDDGTWRLCKRMGDTITTLSSTSFPGIEIKFPSQAKTKACADELNEHYWRQYEREAKTGMPHTHTAMFWSFVEIIHNHEGLTQADYRKVRGE